MVRSLSLFIIGGGEYEGFGYVNLIIVVHIADFQHNKYKCTHP